MKTLALTILILGNKVLGNLTPLRLLCGGGVHSSNVKVLSAVTIFTTVSTNHAQVNTGNCKLSFCCFKLLKCLQKWDYMYPPCPPPLQVLIILLITSLQHTPSTEGQAYQHSSIEKLTWIKHEAFPMQKCMLIDFVLELTVGYQSQDVFNPIYFHCRMDSCMLLVGSVVSVLQ